MNGIFFLFMLLQILSFVIVIALVVKFWNLCNAVQEMNRTVQFMAYDLKDLHARLAGPPTTSSEGTDTHHG